MGKEPASGWLPLSVRTGEAETSLPRLLADDHRELRRRVSPFRITCVTCQARLTVRHEAAIGQILACPRCGSMVQVTAPVGDSGAESAALTGAAALPAVPAVGGSDSQSAGASTSSATFEDVADFGAELHAPPVGASQAPAAQPPVVAPPLAPVAAAKSGMSAATFTALAVGSALAGSALVAGVLMWLSPGDAANVPPASVPAAASTIAPTVPAQSAEAKPVAEAQPTVASANETSPVAAPAEPNEPQSTAGAVAATAMPPASDELFGHVPAGPPTSPDAASGVAEPAADAPAPNAVAVQDDAAPRFQIDPLEVDPEGLDLSLLLNGPSPAPAIAASEQPQSAPIESEAPTHPGEEAAAAEPPPEEPIEPPAAAEVLLARRLPAITVTDMPLAKFLQFATSLSAMPVSVDPAELRLAAVTAASPVSANVADATILELLTTAVKPLRLAPIVEDGQIVLRRAVADQRRTLDYPVADLVAGDASELAGWVASLVAPESWTTRGGDGVISAAGPSLHIEQSERIAYETILFLERYRAARGLRPQSKYPAKLLATWSAEGLIAERMAQPTTFTFSRPTSLVELVAWWQQELGARILVDWPALAEARLDPHSRALATAAAMPWRDALTAALEPLGLGWRAVDAGTIQITTRERIETNAVLEVYRLNSEAAARRDAIRAKVGSLFAAGAPGIVDAAGTVLIVRQPSRVHRELAAWLAAEGLRPSP